MACPGFLRDADIKGPPRRIGAARETWALEPAVIPAKAGRCLANLREYAADGLDSRFRGNDWRFVRDAIPNGTATPPGVVA